MTRQTPLSIPNPTKEKWLERFLRFGLVSKGVVYCLLGIIAVLAAAGLSGEKAGKAEALRLIYEQPFGQVVIAVLLVGILGYVTLRLFQAVKDIDGKGSDVKGIFTRIGFGISALIYIGLGIYILKMLMQDSSGGDSRTMYVGKILSWPYGQWIIGIVGAIVIGNGIWQIIKGATAKFMKNISGVRGKFESTFKRAGMLGYISRGCVLLIIGYLLIHGAITSNPGEAKGSEQAFAFIENKFGSWLMGLIAFGLVAYGIFMFVKARFQKLKVNLD